jgi:hypothetical protein
MLARRHIAGVDPESDRASGLLLSVVGVVLTRN